MIVQTSRFGQVEVDDDRVITFEKGLLGFPRYQQYVLIQPSDEGYFFWLQSLDSPELAFVVTDPSLFVQDYKVPLKADQMSEMGLESIQDAQVLVIVNKRGNVLTGNLQGPLVVHTNKKRGHQLVLSDRRFSTRTPLLKLGGDSVSAASA
ncbi:MAG: flagellar assembly protein FliW [Planctomycetota bacterium]|jgi:flagellar assembly factor FliW